MSVGKFDNLEQLAMQLDELVTRLKPLQDRVLESLFMGTELTKTEEERITYYVSLLNDLPEKPQ